MKKIYEFGRILIASVPAFYFTIFFYRDLFIGTAHNTLLFLVWVFPCIHMTVVCFRLVLMLTGRQYRKYNQFSLLKTDYMTLSKDFPVQTGFMRLFFAIKGNDRERIVSGVFLHQPNSIWVYKDAFDKLKIISLSSLLIKLIGIVANLAVLAVLRFFLLYSITKSGVLLPLSFSVFLTSGEGITFYI